MSSLAMSSIDFDSSSRLERERSVARANVSDKFSLVLEKFFSGGRPLYSLGSGVEIGSILKCMSDRVRTRDRLLKLNLLLDEFRDLRVDDLTLAIANEVDYIERNGYLRNGFVYIGNTYWLDASQTSDYVVGKLVDEAFIRFMKGGAADLVPQVGEKTDVFHLGFGNGNEGLTVLNALLKGDLDFKAHMIGSQTDPQLNIIVVDQSSSMMRRSINRVCKDFDGLGTRYDFISVHADFTELGVEDMKDKVRGGVVSKAFDAPNRFVVMRGITSGNYTEGDLFETFDRYVRSGDTLYVDTSLWDGDESKLAALAEMYANNTAYRLLVTENFRKLLRILGAPIDMFASEVWDRSISCRYTVIEGSGGSEDLIGRIEFVYTFDPTFLRTINSRHSINFPSEVVLYFSQRRTKAGFVLSLENKGFEVSDTVVKKEGVNEIMGVFATKR